MPYFLSPERRSTLINDLGKLFMSTAIAEDYASIGDGDLMFLDRYIAAVIGRIAQRCNQLQERQSPQFYRTIMLTTLLTTDSLIFGAYIAEIGERQLPVVLFPRITKATQANPEEIAVATALALGSMGALQ